MHLKIKLIIKISTNLKYNKNIKKIMDININNYKKYSSIEIEIKPVDNKYGKFII